VALPTRSAITAAKPGSGTAISRASEWSSRWPALAAAIAALLLLAAAGGWFAFGGHLMKPAQAGHLSIVVLPFANVSDDPSQDYFADGVTENLTTELSRIRDSFVIARNTAFTFEGKSVDAKEIGKQLGVRYVLEGSVQRDQNRHPLRCLRRAVAVVHHRNARPASDGGNLRASGGA
jgi:TolB-like protein